MKKSEWLNVASETAFLPNAGGCVKLGDLQIAVFNFGKGEWYAVQNQCPHQQQMVLSRGLIGDAKGEPKVSCPLHKNSFSLCTGEHLGGNAEWKLQTFPVKVEGGAVWLEIPQAVLERAGLLEAV
ncbi:MAG: nitrite reductase small subunit NirD [Trueperaceae bacterium]